MTLLLALLSLGTAHAVETEFAGTEEPPEEVAEKPESKASVEIGGTFATGNAVFYTVNGQATASHKWKRNKLAALGGINIGAGKPDTDEDGTLNQAERASEFQESARRYFVEGRYDRFISDKDSFYFLAGAFVDSFAGYDLRSHEQLGYSRTIIDNDTSRFVTELGFDWAQENYVDGVDPNYQDIFAARILLGVEHKFSERVAFTDVFEVYENVVDLEDLRILNTASFSSALNSHISLKLSHNLIFDNVPVEGFVKLDQTTMATLVVSFL